MGPGCSSSSDSSISLSRSAPLGISLLLTELTQQVAAKPQSTIHNVPFTGLGVTCPQYIVLWFFLLGCPASSQSLVSSQVSGCGQQPGPPVLPENSHSPLSFSCSVWLFHFLSLERPYSILPPCGCPSRTSPNLGCIPVPLCPSAKSSMVTPAS